MYQEQRLEEIIKLLEDRGGLSAKEMVDHFHVSKDTIRRDFAILAKEKRAKASATNSRRFIANPKSKDSWL